NNMNVLLINVSKKWNGRVYCEYPLGLGMLGTIARNNGYTVKIYDMTVEDDNIEQIVFNFNPLAIGLSFPSTSAHTAYLLVERLRKITTAFIFAGGIHPTLFYKEALNKGIELVTVGEGENTILPILEAVQNSDVKESELKKIHGIAYKNKAGEIVYNSHKSEVILDNLPFVDRKLFNLNSYSTHSIISSRGCIHNCIFCSSNGLAGCSPRMSSPEKILSEIEYLVSEFGEINLYWADDMFFYNHKDRITFCNMLIRKSIPVKYVIQLRADNINNELVCALKNSGCVKIAFGAESGSEKILKSIKKGITTDTIVEAINCAVKNLLRIKTWWIIGLPGSFDEQLEALKIIENTRPNEVAVHTFAPLPGSEIWNEANRYGIHLPSSLEQLEELSYYCQPESIKLDYLSLDDLHLLIESYENRLKELGYISTDKGNSNESYIYTTPNQKNTFKV
ncbi:MAG TPA: radical SAM protein, partial [Clostridia bacterium]|nr:radical SAM protein [Clostridia bacterium]